MLVYRLPRDFDPSKMCSPGEGQDRNQWEADGPGWKGSGPTGLGYPDATTTSKGIVQVDRVGGLAVAAGVASLARPAWWQVHTRRSQWTPRGASRAAQRWFLTTSPPTHVATDILSGALPFTIQKAGTATGTRRALNLIEGANLTLTVAKNSYRYCPISLLMRRFNGRGYASFFRVDDKTPTLR